MFFGCLYLFQKKHSYFIKKNEQEAALQMARIISTSLMTFTVRSMFVLRETFSKIGLKPYSP